MKKLYYPWLLTAALLGLVPTLGQAQITKPQSGLKVAPPPPVTPVPPLAPPPGADSLRRKLYQVFAHIDANQVPTGYLAEYATPLLPLDTYSGTVLADSNLTDMDVFRQLYVTVASGRVLGQDTLPDLLAFNARRQAAEGASSAIPLAVEYLAYARIKPTALQDNLLSAQNEQVYDVAAAPKAPMSDRCYLLPRPALATRSAAP